MPLLASAPRSLVLGVIAVGLATMGACEAETDGPPPIPCEPTDGAIGELFDRNCTSNGCHVGFSPAAGLKLDQSGIGPRLSGTAAQTCASKTLIVAGDPEASFLYEKLSSATPECGARMPTNGALAEHELACVRDWIEAMGDGCETCGGGVCVNFQVSVNHCGACGQSCPDDASCNDGACVCPEGLTLCGEVCADIRSSVDHCGGCDSGCNGSQVCSLSACKDDCDGGLTKCGQSCVDAANDEANCGACGVSCGNGVCGGGECLCAGGADPMSDPNHCGTCGNVCPPGQICSDGECTCSGNDTVSLSQDVQPWLTNKCATQGCHRPPIVDTGLDLSEGATYDENVDRKPAQCNANRRLVLPGDPSRSYLVDKILGTDMCSGGRMPLGGGQVTNAELKTLGDWICNGAPNN